MNLSERRDLASTFDLSKSKVTVSNTTVTPYSEITVTVTAYDSSNVRITTGGEKLAIDVHNECALDAGKM